MEDLKGLVKVENKQAVTDSRNVAEHFDKQHKNVIQAINNLVAENSAAKSFFFESTFENRGKQYPCYIMNRDGFSLLVMGFTGAKALEWKLKYINAFNAMEKALREPKVKQIAQDKTKEMRAAAMLKNAETRQAKILLEIADASNIKTYKETLRAKAANMLAGETLLPMPKSERERHNLKWFCKQIGKSESWSSQLGKLLKKRHIEKIEGETGEYVNDIAHNNAKQVQNFEWYVDYLLPIVQKDGFID